MFQNFRPVALAAITTIALSGAAHGQSARDYISIVGSSTVYPFATVVAERFGRSSEFIKQHMDERTWPNIATTRSAQLTSIWFVARRMLH